MSLFVELLCTVYRVVVIVVVAIFYTFVPRPCKSVRSELVLVTGAGSGIGRLIAVRFAARGATVVLWDVTPAGNAETSRLITESGGRAHCYTCDVSKREEVYRVARLVTEEVGYVTMLVNNAGIVTGKPFLDSPDDAIERTTRVNMLAHCWTIKAFLPRMIAENHGHLVSVASIAGVLGCPGLVDYCMTKHGSIGLTKTLDLELSASGVSGVKTTVICPYFTDTGMFEGCVARFPWLLPMLKPEDVAERSMRAILTDRRTVYIPRLLYFLETISTIMPIEATMAVSKLIGSFNLMDTYVGRKKTK